MEENKDLNKEKCCSDSNDPNCCASNSGASSGGSGKFKSIIFIIVLLAACAVAAHAIIAKNGTNGEKSACGIYNVTDCSPEVKAAEMKAGKTCPKGASFESKDSADEIADLREAIKAAGGCSSKKGEAKIAGCSSKKEAAKMASGPKTGSK
ncbi:MAG: hypothetical protein FVQ80_08570 [Planctomycetes bacterium]|nr:hypothetical protein [Planctomycetota bacterium]